MVSGIFGLQRHVVTVRGAHAHAGATPMHLRRDAFLAAARSAARRSARAPSGGRTRAPPSGTVSVSPGIVTAFNGICEFSLDQRAFDAGVLAEMVDEAREASQRIAAEEGTRSSGSPSSPRRRSFFAPELVEIAAGVIADLTGECAAACRAAPCTTPPRWRAWCPSVMVFVRSIGGVSHTKDEDSSVRGPGAVGPGDARADAADPGLGRGDLVRGAPWTSA